jgi:hypothetical protein
VNRANLIFYSVVILITSVFLAGCAGSPASEGQITLVSPEDRTYTQFTDPVLIEGERNYNLLCAHCHGYNGEGQLAITISETQQLGMHIVPAHDSTGHTWQHPEQLLIRVIKEGVQNPLDQYPMPAYGDALSDETINAILTYIKLWWTEEQRAHQRGLTENWARIDRELGIGGAETDEP